MRIPFAVSYNAGRTKPLSVQRVLNLYAEEAPPNEKTPVALIGTPGRTIIGAAFDTAPVRGMKVMDGDLYVAAGATVYRVTSSAAATAIGTIGGDGPVGMATNGTQILIVDSLGNGYIVTSTTVTAIADPDWPGASSCCFVDGYFIVTQPHSKRFYISALLDGTGWDALDFASQEADPDDLVAAIADHNELWLFGETTTEVWTNAGGADFPFQRIGGAIITRGLAGRFAATAADNTIFWLADDQIVYRANGYLPTRVSTHAIEFAIGAIADWRSAQAFSYTQEGHSFVGFTFPDALTIVYDAATNLWHERQSGDRLDWGANGVIAAYDKLIVGGADTGALYELSLDAFGDAGAAIRRQVTTPAVWADSGRLTMSRFQADFEVGIGLETGQGSDPQAMLDWSDDGGKTWSSEHWASIGAIGNYGARAQWHRLGQARQRYLRLTVSDPVPVRFLGCYGDVVGGRI